MENAKSLILQRGVSENPEKILSRKRCKMGEEIGAFLEELVSNREARMKSSEQTIMDFVMELGMRRNKKIFVSLREK
ncbi:MAG: hypothetical protein J6S85_02005 [Methanobrevibacter sp.]|nr:hypothetical protein [Methanobrevibacter sp.]